MNCSNCPGWTDDRAQTLPEGFPTGIYFVPYMLLGVSL
jgi:hypothetical protein